jgi:serine/threonine-protein kinase
VFLGRRADDPASYAVKVIWPHLTANTDPLLRFRREIDTLSTLDHPQLVKFVASGRQGECFYYVMEYVPGGTLRQRLRAEGPRPVAEVLDLLAGLAAPLDHLHTRGVVHRDVKPGNIFYAPAAPSGLVLGDFGLARRVSDRGITLADEFIGTPLYLAPEVFQSAEFDHTVDFYALGVCGLEMLHGNPVVQEKDSMRLIGLLMRQGHPQPHEVVPDLPAPVARLLERLLSADRAARPQSGADLVEAVQAARAALA